MKVVKIYNEYKRVIFLSIFLIIIGIIFVGSLLMPSLFYDQWIWKYYWGPVVADASAGTAIYNGIEAQEGYTIVSELTYGLLVIIALYLIYKILKKLEITVDWRFALALMPYILFGPVSRVLEDTGYFNPPLVYWFISPLIYLQITIYALFFLYLGHYLEKKFNSPKVTVNRILFTGGLIFLVPSSILILGWIFGYRWGDTSGIHLDVFLIVVGLVLLIVALVYLFAHYVKKEELKVYKNPLNLTMLGGHLIDGITSYISIKDPFAMGLYYSEKHPASNLLLETWGPLFPIVKFLLIIIVIYMFDILYKDELKDHLTLINLLKIGILILGFSPGMRDIIRVLMGV